MFKVVSYAEMLVLTLIWEDASYLVVDSEGYLTPLKKRHSILSNLAFPLQMAVKKISEGRIFNTCSSYNFQDSSLPENDLYHSLSNH